MLISLEKKFIFVANTKAASTSIESSLMPYADVVSMGTPGRKHIALAFAKKKFSFLFQHPKYPMDSFYTFGVMREPMDWIASWYRYRKGNKVENVLPEDMTFEDFWNRKDWNIVRGDGSPYLQSRLFRIGGEQKCDFLIPYHRLAEVYPQIAEGLGLKGHLPRLNVSNIADQKVIPAHMHDEVRTHFAHDYEIWDRIDEINARGMARLHERQAKADA